MMEKTACVSIYQAHEAAEAALGKLHMADVDLQQVSIVGKGYHGAEHPVGLYNVNDRLQFLGHQGDFWDALRVLLSGRAFLWVPGFGTLAAAGPIAGLLVKGLEGVEIGGGFGVLGAALFNLGVTRDSIADYEQAVTAEQFLLIVHDGRIPVEHACKILHGETQQVTVHRA